MRKRQIAIIPLIFASMIMLLSSIMPHHPHGKLICFTSSHEEKFTHLQKHIIRDMIPSLMKKNVK